MSCPNCGSPVKKVPRHKGLYRCTNKNCLVMLNKSEIIRTRSQRSRLRKRIEREKEKGEISSEISFYTYEQLKDLLKNNGERKRLKYRYCRQNVHAFYSIPLDSKRVAYYCIICRKYELHTHKPTTFAAGRGRRIHRMSKESRFPKELPQEATDVIARAIRNRILRQKRSGRARSTAVRNRK